MRPLAAVLLAVPTLALADFADAIVPISVVGTIFGCSALVVGIVAYTLFRVRRLRHETIRLAIEKGQPLPPDLLEPARRPEPLRDLRLGVILVAVGAGISLFVYFAAGANAHGGWALGFVPGFVGIGYLAAFALGRAFAPKPDADRG